MRKNIICLMALVVAISCVKEIPQEITPEPEQETIGSIVFSAEVENDDVKTTLGADELGKLPLWNSGDEIAIFMGNETGYKFRTAEEGVKKANFQGPVVSGSVPEQVGGNDFDANVGVYPFSIAEGITPKSNGQFDVAVTLPANQSYVKNSFGYGAFPMVAVTETKSDASLKFKNLCGMLKLQIKGDNIPVRYISIKGNNHEKLCGAAVVSAKNGAAPTITFGSTAQEEVILDCGKTGVRLSLTDTTAFYLVLPPVTFTGGITIKIVTTYNTVIEKTTTTSIQIKRSSIKSIKAFTIENVVPYYTEGTYSEKGIAVLGDWDGDGTQTTLYWAPVNCGYEAEGDVNKDSDHRLGKLYQWGAGDASIQYTYTNAEGSRTLSDTEIYSGYYGDPKPDIWYGAYVDPDPKKTIKFEGKATDKWNNNQGPCPDGWRLPTPKEFEVLCAGKNSNYGWVAAGTYAGQTNTYAGAEFFGANSDKTAGKGVFFPAAGYRHYDKNGVANFRGQHTQYWTSKVSSFQSANRLYFFSGGLYTGSNSTQYRASALSVRCVAGDGDPSGETPQSVILTSVAVSEIDNHTAVCGASVISEGDATVTERGICYSTLPVPTVAHARVIGAGSGVGSFTCNLAGLSSNATYYVRAYAVNANGTYYGEIRSFTTLNTSPIPSYTENGMNCGAAIAVLGDWDGDGNQTTLYWAPVNCGYEAVGPIYNYHDHRLGKLYQWGAGDESLPYYDGNVTKVVARELYHDYADADFSPFYDQTIIKGTLSDKWNNNQGPCPEGWRLPTYHEYEVLCAGKNSANGWVEGVTYAGQANKYNGAEFFGANTSRTPGTGVFFPTTGGVMWFGDRFENMGFGNFFGGYWTSTVESSDSGIDSDSASLMFFMNDFLYPLYTMTRANAFSVRCVRE